MKQGQLLSVDDVLRLTRVARATLHRMVRAGAFPAPRRGLGIRRTLWRSDDVIAWMRNREERRNDQ